MSTLEAFLLAGLVLIAGVINRRSTLPPVWNLHASLYTRQQRFLEGQNRMWIQPASNYMLFFSTSFETSFISRLSMYMGYSESMHRTKKSRCSSRSLKRRQWVRLLVVRDPTGYHQPSVQDA